MTKEALCARARRSTLALEALEERIAPAGYVTAAVVGGNLVITGDADDNNFLIGQSGEGYLWIVPAPGTYVNGDDASAQPFADVTGGIKADLGDGNDAIEIRGVAIDGGVTIVGGHGNKSVTIHSDSQIGGAVSIRGGDGANVVFIGASISKGVSISTAAGGIDLNLAAYVGGAVSIKGGAMNDSAVLNGGFAGSVSIDLGGGDNVAMAAGAFDGAISVKAGAGNNTFAGTNAMIAGNLSVAFGDGATVATLRDTQVNGMTSISTRVGDHTLAWDGGGALKGITAVNGNGDAVVSLTGVDTGGLTIKNGAGIDTFTATGLSSTNAVTILNGEGETHTTLDDPAVSKGMTIVNKGGHDTISITDGVFGGSVSISNGDGDSDAVISRTLIGVTPGANPAAAGGFTYKSGYGLHTADFVMAVGKSASITMGGASSIDIESSLIGGPLSVKTGALSDIFTIGQDSELGSVSVNLGDGDNEVWIDDSDFDGALTVRTGAGADYVLIEAENNDHASVFAGPVTILTGAGNDLFALGTSDNAADTADFRSRVLLDGGAGTNVIMEGYTAYAVQPVGKHVVAPWEL